MTKEEKLYYASSIRLGETVTAVYIGDKIFFGVNRTVLAFCYANTEKVMDTKLGLHLIEPPVFDIKPVFWIALTAFKKELLELLEAE